VKLGVPSGNKEVSANLKVYIFLYEVTGDNLVDIVVSKVIEVADRVRTIS